MKPMPSEAEIRAIVGHKFPGGTYTIEHWENFLLTECTGADPLPDGLVHPVALFHVPILGCRTTIGEMFALGKAQSDSSIGIESYDWEFFKPLRENTPYAITGSIISAERRKREQGSVLDSAKKSASEQGSVYDRIQFRFELAEKDGALAARTTITWHYGRFVQ